METGDEIVRNFQNGNSDWAYFRIERDPPVGQNTISFVAELQKTIERKREASAEGRTSVDGSHNGVEFQLGRTKSSKLEHLA